MRETQVWPRGTHVLWGNHARAPQRLGLCFRAGRRPRAQSLCPARRGHCRKPARGDQRAPLGTARDSLGSNEDPAQQASNKTSGGGEKSHRDPSEASVTVLNFPSN